MAANSASWARGSGHYYEVLPANIGEAFVTATEQDGLVVDRNSLSKNYLSGKVVLLGTFVLAATETIRMSANIRTADNSGMSTNVADLRTAPDLSAQTIVSQVIATGGAGGTTETVTVGLDFDLSGARRYIQYQFTLTRSASATGTVGAIWIFSGADGHDNLT